MSNGVSSSPQQNACTCNGRVAARICPICESVERIGDGEAIWPTDWKCSACSNRVPVADGLPVYAPHFAKTPTGFDSSAFNWLVEHEDGHFWFEPRNALLLGLARKYFSAGGHYLEIGCGTGFVLDHFARAGSWSTVTGSEIHLAGLKYARRRLGDRASFVQMDARRIAARDTFAVIGAYDVLEHIDDDIAALKAIYSALAPGGGFIASVPQHPILWSAADDLAHHVRRYRRGELESKLRSTGFQIIASTSFAATVLPLMVANRLSYRRGQIEDFVRSEFAVPRLLNYALKLVLNLEVATTLKGLAWPLGGSRVVIARK